MDPAAVLVCCRDGRHSVKGFSGEKIMQIRLPSLQLIEYEVPFFAAYGIFLMVMMLRTSFYGEIFSDMLYRGIILLCVLLLIYKEYLDGIYTVKLLVILALFAFLALNVQNAATFTAMSSVIFLFCARNVDFHKIAVFSFYLSGAVLFLVIFSSLTGIITNYHMDAGTSRERAFLGFLYALYPSAYFKNLVALYIYEKRKQVSLIILAVLAVCNVWIYRQTDSRLSYYLTFALILLGVVMYLRPRTTKLRGAAVAFNPLKAAAGFAATFSFVICAVVSVVLHVFYDSEIGWMSVLNKLMGNRLAYGHESYIKYGIHLFANDSIEWIGNGLSLDGVSSDLTKYLYVDNLYFQTLQRYGTIMFLIILSMLTVLMYILWKRRDYTTVVIMLFIAAHAIMDDLVIHIWYNTFVLLVSCTLFRDPFLKIGPLRQKIQKTLSKKQEESRHAEE